MEIKKRVFRMVKGVLKIRLPICLIVSLFVYSCGGGGSGVSTGGGLIDTRAPNANNPFYSPMQIAIDPSNNYALVIDPSPYSEGIIAVHLGSGERVVLSR